MLQFENDLERQLWIARTMRGDTFEQADNYIMAIRARSRDSRPEGGLWLIHEGGTRIALIKTIREFTGLGLKEAKELTEGLPKKLPRDDESFRKAIFEAGGTAAWR